MAPMDCKCSCGNIGSSIECVAQWKTVLARLLFTFLTAVPGTMHSILALLDNLLTAHMMPTSIKRPNGIGIVQVFAERMSATFILGSLRQVLSDAPLDNWAEH
ncbi:hypothetical protein BOTBODRAFT_600970 [Botryobasidium botryosum FD-172 SS1]|uniref:Uncharacterized protein n=1 Tax=Botryobasidium botryosum (strain FD-172 SS1) TaxID=930990 RepID=A0A067MZA1_BOTB1|nr:hypothetical protein BOTBODRAFT_600970 [Botryobasidium botryosum FD-172 SS1]